MAHVRVEGFGKTSKIDFSCLLRPVEGRFLGVQFPETRVMSDEANTDRVVFGFGDG